MYIYNIYLFIYVYKQILSIYITGTNINFDATFPSDHVQRRWTCCSWSIRQYLNLFTIIRIRLRKCKFTFLKLLIIFIKVC